MRKFVFLALIFGMLSGCANSSQNKIRESEGLRIIAAASGAAEILDEIGLSKAIVGVDERNEVSGKVERVTTGHSFNIEKLISLRPTHVILDSLIDSKEFRKQFQDYPITFVSLPLAESISDIFVKYEILGRAFDKPSEASSASSALKMKFDSFKSEGRSFQICFLYLRGTNAIYLMGGKGSGADSLIEALGSRDVGAEKSSQPFSPLSAEVMRTLNPEVLLLMTGGLESIGGLTGLSKLPGLSNTRAVKRMQVILIDDQELLDFGPRTLEVLISMKRQLEQFDVA